MKLFLSHSIDIYDFSESYFGAVFENGEFKELTIQDIKDCKYEIISYDIKYILNQVRKICPEQLPIITDLGQIIKINSGRSKKSYFKNKQPWIFWNRLNLDIGKEETAKLYSIVRDNHNKEKTMDSLLFLAKKLKFYYEESISNIRASQQYDRFYNLENKIQQILNERQLKGIKIDTQKLKTLIGNLETNKNALINNLRYKHNIIDLNYRSIRIELIKKGFQISSKDYDYFNLISFLKTTKITSEICNDIYITLRVKADFDNLQQYITESNDTIYPEFDCIGTITSRIVICYPHIQHLKKENRSIFIAKENFTLLYCDFNQFEPGILASFSKDNIMIELYNSEDIYTNFSNYIFGTKALRKESKILFLSYLYGMSNKKLIESIEDVIKNKGLTKNTSAMTFFSKFKELEKFKAFESEKAIACAYIQSNTTLRRNIKKTKEGKGERSETRFVLSQLIQGTASYILKKAIIDTSRDSEIEFLIPMHDAVLYQVPTEKLEEKKKYIEDCFTKTFKELCPEIDAKVDFKAFDE